jgi:hypothetical protein
MTALMLAALSLGTARADDSGGPFGESPTRFREAYSLTEDGLYAVLRSGETLDGRGWRIRCRKVEGRQIQHCTAEGLDWHGIPVRVIQAETAKLIVNPQAGRIEIVMWKGVGMIGEDSLLEFEGTVFECDLPRPL